MDAWIECVPNISEGRNKEVVDAVADTLSNREGVHLLDVESDADHNRSVITFIARPDTIVDAAKAFVERAIELIDLNKHTGQHPRMGAVDVFPLIPITGVTPSECVRLCHEIAKTLATSLHLPCYLYEDAAQRPDRKNLATVRKSGRLSDDGDPVGAFEWLRAKVPTTPSRFPDYGPNALHATAGATGVGTRFFLIAYNVNLKTTDLELAQSIAEAIRERSGGFKAVKALGFELADQGCVQVSMNLVDYTKTGIDVVFSRIRDLASDADVEVRESEVVGLIPQDAIDSAVRGFLQIGPDDRLTIVPKAPTTAPQLVVHTATGQTLEREIEPGADLGAEFNAIKRDVAVAGSAITRAELIGAIGQDAINRAFCTLTALPALPREQIVEERVRMITGGSPHSTIKPEDPIAMLAPFMNSLASGSPTPGGGSASALAGALAGSLGQMVANLTIGKKKYVEHEARALELRGKLAEQTRALVADVTRDSDAYDGVALARKLPKLSEDQQTARHAAIQAATKHAADVPLSIAERAVQTLATLADLVQFGNASAITDCGVGALLASVCVQGALLNVRVNLLDLEDQVGKAAINARVEEVAKQCALHRDAVMTKVDESISS